MILDPRASLVRMGRKESRELKDRQVLLGKLDWKDQKDKRVNKEHLELPEDLDLLVSNSIPKYILGSPSIVRVCLSEL